MSQLQTGGLLCGILLALAKCPLSKLHQTVVTLWLWPINSSVLATWSYYLLLFWFAFHHYSKPVNISTDIAASAVAIVLGPYLTVVS